MPSITGLASELTASEITTDGDFTKVAFGTDYTFSGKEDSYRFKLSELQKLCGNCGTAFHNVRDFGAVGDGSHDDTSAFESAIGSSGPVVVFVPATSAHYRVANQITISRSDVVIVGEGPSSIIRHIGAAQTQHTTQALFKFSGSSHSAKIARCGVYNCWMQGPQTEYTPSAGITGVDYGCAVRCDYVTNFTVAGCFMSHFTGRGVFVFRSSNVMVRDNWVFKLYSDINWTNRAWDLVTYYDNEAISFINNHCHSNCDGHIAIDGYSNLFRRVSGNVCFAADDNGFLVSAKSGLPATSSVDHLMPRHNIMCTYGAQDNAGMDGNIIITDNLCIAGRWTNIYVNSDVGSKDDSDDRLLISNNILCAAGWFNDHGTGGASQMSASICVLLSARGAVISNNMILEGKGTPFPSPGILYDNMQRVAEPAIIHGNYISRCNGTGIFVGDGEKVMVHDNYIYDCSEMGIYCYSSYAFPTAKTVSSINTSTDTFSATAHGFADGDRVQFKCTTTFFKVNNMVAEERSVFYIRDKQTDSFKIAATPTGAALDIVVTFTGTCTVTRAYNQHCGHTIRNNTVIARMSLRETEGEEFPAYGADTGTDTITTSNVHGLADGYRVRFSTDGTLFSIGGSTVNNYDTYYVRDITGGYTSKTFKLCTTAGSAALDITAQGSGTHRVHRVLDGGSYGIIVSITNERDPVIIDGNLVVNAQPRNASGEGFSMYGISNQRPNMCVMINNCVVGCSAGICVLGSITDRKVEQFQISNNMVANTGIPFMVYGTQNGLVLIDDTNRIISVSSTIRAYQYCGCCGQFGSLCDGKVVMPFTTRASQTVTVANASDTITCTAHGYKNGDRVRLSGTVPTPYAAGTDYYVSSVPTSSTFKLSTVRDGTGHITATQAGTPTMTQQIPSIGTYVVGDRLINQSWASASDPVDWICTTAGAVGTCVFTQRKMTTA